MACKTKFSAIQQVRALNHLRIGPQPLSPILQILSIGRDETGSVAYLASKIEKLSASH